MTFDAVHAGNWKLFAAMVLIAAVWAARKWAPGKIGTFFQTDRGGALLAVLGGFGGGFSHALMVGTPFTWGLVLTCFEVSVSAAGGYAVFKKILGL